MVDLTNPSDLNQATPLRTVTSNEVVRPSGTESERPIEDEASANTAANSDDEATSNDEPEQDPLDRATSALEELLSENELPKNTRLRIELDEEDGRFIYQSVDRETGGVVSQFPPEDILELLRTFRSPTGIAIDDSV